MNMDMSQYLDVFLEESREHLRNLNDKLLELEKNKEDLAALNEIFRAAHTLKGMSSTMGFEDLADLTHHMEDVLVDLKEGALTANTIVVDILFKCFDRIQIIVDNIELTGSASFDNQDLIDGLADIKQDGVNLEFKEEIGKEKEDAGTFVSDKFEFNEFELTVLREAYSKGYNIFHIKIFVDPDCLMKSVRAFMVFKAIEEEGEVIKSIPPAQELDEGHFDTEFELFAVTHLDHEEIAKSLANISEIELRFIEEIDLGDLESVPSSTRPAKDDIKTAPVGEKAPSTTSPDGEITRVQRIKQTVRVDIERLDNLMNLVGELVMHKGRLEQIASNSKLGELNETIEQIDRVSGDLQSVVMQVRMVPIEQVFNRFPRMVRDLAKELHKEVDFVMEGKETELDRTVIDEIGDPLVHLLRNAIDHGLELPEERIEVGKPAQGNLTLRASHEGNNVYIEVEDNGRGINVDKIKNLAIKRDLISAEEAEKMSVEEAAQILFYPGFSTAEEISDVSGRGVGLDVVKSKIEALSGEIHVETKAGQGTKFKIKLPLTLAIIQALMVSIHDEIYAIPLSSVDETTMISKEDIKMVQNQEVMMMRGNVLPIFRLSSLLEIPANAEEKQDMYVVVVRKADKQIGLMVDTLIGQQEIVIKSLGKVLGGIPGIAGAIVAGDGNVRLILDVATLF